MKWTMLILISLSWVMCGVLAFRIFMRDMINNKHYTYDPVDSLILFVFTVGGYITLLTSLMICLSKAQIFRKIIERIIGIDIVDKDDE